MFGLSGEHLTKRLRRMTFENLLRQEVSFFDHPDNTVGSLTTKLATDASAVRGVSSNCCPSLFWSFIKSSNIKGHRIPNRIFATSVRQPWDWADFGICLWLETDPCDFGFCARYCCCWRSSDKDYDRIFRRIQKRTSRRWKGELISNQHLNNMAVLHWFSIFFTLYSFIQLWNLWNRWPLKLLTTIAQ